MTCHTVLVVAETVFYYRLKHNLNSGLSPSLLNWNLVNSTVSSENCLTLGLYVAQYRVRHRKADYRSTSECLAWLKEAEP